MGVLASSCMTYVQIFDTTSLDLEKEENGNYYFENDTVKITYSFWFEKGIMSFTIENKLNVPIYVDWKKSSYVGNQVKLNYWSNEVITKSVSSSEQKTYYYKKANSDQIVSSSSKQVKLSGSTTSQERITFIPPKSIIFKNSFHIYPVVRFDFGANPSFKEEKSNYKAGKMTKIYSKKFEKSNSPAFFRNFLTFSVSEKFESEFYVDNGFFISEVREMKLVQFQEYRKHDNGLFIRDDKGYAVKFSVYSNESSFYIHIPKGYQIRN